MAAALLVVLAGFGLVSAQERGVRVESRAGGDTTPAPVRVALVVGNDAYAGVPLRNAVNDARAMAVVLEELGFAVETVTDADQRTLEQAVERFAGRIGREATALFYYAGHGMQVEGENYLLPVDFRAASEEDVKYGAIPAGRVHEKMDRAGAQLSMVILDACRDNPFRWSRSGTRGLAAMVAGKGSFIAFATAPGSTATDNPAAGNGLFTQCLLQALAVPDLTIDEVFSRTREAVYRQSGEKQLPWTASSVIGTFVFRDLAAQERALEAERQQLEAALRKARQEREAAEAARAEKALREASRREAELQVRLEAQRLEEERLAREARQRESQADEEVRVRQEEARLTAERLGRQAAEEARLELLRRQLEAEQAARQPVPEGLTLEAARAEAARLRAQVAAARQQLEAERDRAVATLRHDYAPLLERVNRPQAAKDMFETDAEYRARLARALDERTAVEESLRKEQAGITQRYDSLLAAQAKAGGARIDALTSARYPVPGLKCVLDRYDADRQLFYGRVGTSPISFPCPPDVARGVWERRELLQVRAWALYSEKNPEPEELTIWDPGTNREWKPGRPSPAEFRGAQSPSQSDAGKIQYGHYIDNGDDTITDTATGLMWTQADSRAATGQGMNWHEAKAAVDGLTTGGHADWRLPTIAELNTIYDLSYQVLACDRNSKNPLRMCPLFSDGGAYWYWSSENAGSGRSRVLNFSTGFIAGYLRGYGGGNLGARGVRSPGR